MYALKMPDSTPSLIAFGIGCYSFEAPDADHLLVQHPEGTYGIQDWATDVEQTLRSLPSLDRIRVEGFGSVRGDSPPSWRNQHEQVLRSLPHSSLHRGGGLRPHPVRGQISFELTIPVHVQERVFPFGEPSLGTRFEVDLRYGYGMPVAYVRAADNDQSPSMAVAIVREFLREEFTTRLSGSPIKFTCMGPSPMWNDCFISWGQSGQVEFADVTVGDPPGYRRIEFEIRPSAQGRSLVDAYELIKTNLVEELSLYYEMVSRNNLLHSRDSYIESELSELVSHHQSGGVGAWFWRRFRGERRTNNLLLEILAIDSEHKRSMGGARRDWEEIRARSVMRPFDHSFEYELSKRGQDRTESARAVTSLLNDRHNRETQLFGVVSASILGGVVGSAITAIVQAQT